MAGTFIGDLGWSCQKLLKASINEDLSKTCEIHQGTPFWPPFLIGVCSCTPWQSAPLLLGSQAEWFRFENLSRAS